MNKKFLSALLYGALIAVPASTFVACNDYDDDISSLQSQVDKNAETAKSELEAQISALRNQISALESAKDALSQELADARKACAEAADNALSAAQKAQAAADEAKTGGEAAKLAAEAAQKAADEAAKTLSTTVAAVAQLETKVASLEVSVAKLQEADRNFSIQLATINEAISTLQQNVKNNTDGIAANKQAVADALAKINAMESALRTSINEVAASVGAKIDVINAELNNIKSIYATNDALNAKYNELVATNARLEEQIKTNNNYIAALQETVKSLASKDAELAEKLKTNYDTILEKLTASNAELGIATAKISALENTVSTLTTQYNALSAAKADVTYVDNINAQLTKLIEGLQKTMSDMTASNASQDRSIEVLMNDVKNLQKGVTDLEHLVGSNAAEAKKQLDEAVAKLQGEIAEKVSGVQANLDEAVAELDEKIAANKDEIANVKKELQGNIDDVLGQLIGTQADVAGLQGDLRILAGEVAQNKTDLQGEIAAAIETANKYTDAAVAGLAERVGINEGNIADLITFQNKLEAIGGEDLSKLVTDGKLTTELQKTVNKVMDDVKADYQTKEAFTKWVNEELTAKILPQYVKASELNDKFKTYLEQPGGFADRVSVVETLLNGDGSEANPGILNRVDVLEGYMEDLGLMEAKLSKRLTSLTFIPDAYIEGIPTMQFKTLQYVSGGKTYTRENNNATTIKYRMNPSGVNVNAIKEAGIAFLANKATNTKAALASPIEYVKGSAKMTDGNLTLNVKKTQATLNGNVNFNQPADGKFFIAAVGVPVGDNFLTTEEKSNGGAVVYSDFVRLSEKRFAANLMKTVASAPTHLWSRTELENNKNVNSNIYVENSYAEDVDLIALVKACEDNLQGTHVGAFDDYASYGLKIEFAVEGQYKIGDNQTDQQKFAKIVTVDGKQYLRSIVYEGGVELEHNQAAIDREPIVTARLKDTTNGKTVAERCFKVKWTSKTPVDLGNLKNVTLNYNCDGYTCMVTTAEMNQLIYAQIGENGMSSTTFHALYKDNKLTKKSGVGQIEVVAEEINGVTSYQLKWTVSYAEVGGAIKADKSVTASFNWESVDGRGDVKFNLGMTVKAPSFGVYGHNGSYWNDGYTSITMNPLIYKTESARDFCTFNIDLVNSFVDANGKPATIAESIIKKTNYTGTPDADIVFDQSRLSQLGLGNRVTATANTLSIDGRVAARIVLDDSNVHRLVLEEVDNANSSALAGEGLGSADYNPTAEAKMLLGKSIPVKVIATTCDNSSEYIAKQFYTSVIKPFNVQSEMEDVFYETTVNGSRVSVAKALQMKDWNGYYVAEEKLGNDDKHKWSAELYEYYKIGTITWNTKAATTNLFKDAQGNLVPSATQEGSMLFPDKASFTYDAAANELVYMNGGTQLGKEFVIKCPVNVEHRWGVEETFVYITVKPGSGN